MGVSYYTLAEWRQKRKAYGDHAFVGSGIRRDAPLSENERRLMRANVQLRKANEILKDALGFFRKRPEEVKPEWLHEYVTLRRYRCSVHALCRVLKVSESGYYRSLRMQGSLRLWQLLLGKIYEEHPDNRNYGVGRILLALAQRGVKASRSTVKRVLKKGGLLKSPARRSQSLTRADAAAQKAENLIRRNFTLTSPDQKWLTGGADENLDLKNRR